MAVTTSQVQQLYIAYFNRPADFFGLTFQTAQANQFGLQFVADQFSKSPEYIATYAGKGIGEIVDTIYMNLFGRHAEPAGLKFWGDLLSNPKSGVTVGNAALTIATGAINGDRISVDNKLIAANAFYASLDTNSEIVGYSGDAANAVLKTWMTGITDQASLDAAITPASLLAVSTAATAAHDGAISVNSLLTAGTDLFVGTAVRDTITAVIDIAGSTSTLTALDSIDGGAGIDTLIINDLDGSGIPAGVSVTNVENIIVRGAGNVTMNSKSFAGVSSVKVTQSANATVTASASTAIEVSGATGNIVVVGGSTETVVATAANTTIDLSAGAGAISATHKAQGTALININDGTAVTVVAEGRSTGVIQIGATSAPTGAVNVTATGKASAASATLGAINVTGGSTVSVKEIATSDAINALTDTVGATVTQGAVNVTGTTKTTSVTVVQSAEVTADPSVVTVPSAKEVQTITFGAMTAGQTLSINGLTFTAAKDLTAAQVASAFANLSTSSVQGTASAGNGIYSGTSNALSFSTGPVVAVGTTQTVTITSSSSNGNLALVAIGGSASGTTAAGVTDGAVGVGGYDGTLGVAAGVVTINGAITGTDVLSTVSLDSYANGSSITSDALTALTLANSSHTLAVNNTAATTLNLSMNNVGDNVNGVAAAINLGSTYTTLNVNADVASSRAALAAGGVQALAVAGTKSVNFTGSTMAALKTVTVSGAAGVTLDASGANVTSVDTSATTGSSSITVNAANATFVGGAGADSVTLSTTTTTKAISLGAGNDTLTLAAGTTTLTAVMDGGAGTDTLKMAAADAAVASATTNFATKFTGFEKLSLLASASGVTNTVDLSNLNNINYVISAGSAAAAAPAVPTAAAVQGVAATSAEATTYTFGAGLAAGESFTVDGVTVTNTGVAAQTSAAVASAFAGTVVAGLTKAGTFATPTGWTGAPAVSFSGSVLTLTNTVLGDATDFTGAATSVAGASTGALVVTHMADAGTLELTAAGSSATVTMNDATGTADSFNIVTKLSTAAINYGTVAVAGVETINLTVTDTAPTSASGSASIQTATLNLTDAALKSVIVTGNANLVLTQSAAALTSVDGSAMTGALTAGTNGTVSQTIKGGAAADVLTANGNADVLIGGAGNDKLVVGGSADLTTLTGGAGSDTFDIGLATTNVNSYATITDLTAGDKILFGAIGATFNASKVSLSDTAVFQDYANAAINATNAGDISWFQFGGNTYVIDNINDGTSFLNGTDVIVKIVGAVDLSTASFSSSAHTLLIVA